MADDLKQCEKKIAELQKELAPYKDWKDNPVPMATKYGTKDTLSLGLRPRRVLNALTGKVSAFDWHPDSRHLASTSQDGKVIIWNAFTNNKDHFIAQESAWFMTCNYSPSGKFIAVGGLDNKCTVYKLPEDEEAGGREQKIHCQLEKHTGYIGTLKYLSEGEIVTGSGDGTAILWDVERKQAKQTFTAHGGDVATIDKHPTDPCVFISGSTDKTCKLWDVRAKGTQVVCTFPGHENSINSVRFCPAAGGAAAFASASDDFTCRLWDLRCFKQLNLYFEENHESFATSVDFSASGKFLFVAHADAIMFAWDTCSGVVVNEYANHDQHLTQVGTSPDGKAVCTSSRDTTLTIWA